VRVISGKRHSTVEAVAEVVLIVPGKGDSMARKLDDKELVSFEELLRANMIQTDAVAQLLIEKGFITEQEFFTKLKQVQADYLRQPHSQ
jgi:hypothetical protein